MLRNIVILAPQGQQQFALAALLRAHNPALTFTPVTTPEDLAAIDPAILQHSRLIAFTSGTIVPRHMLDALGHEAYNFHPGSPDYPGWAPAHFALYDGAKSFGATAHLMTERVDAGSIIGTETFVIPQGTSVRQLEQIAYVRLAYLFWRLSKQLATQTEPFETVPVQWCKTKSTRKKYESMCEIPLDISRRELERRIQAFDDDFRGIHPTITIHGVRFRAAGCSMPQTEPQNQPQHSPVERLQPALKEESNTRAMPGHALYRPTAPVTLFQSSAELRRARH